MDTQTSLPSGGKSNIDLRTVELPDGPWTPDAKPYVPRDHRQPEEPMQLQCAYYNIVNTVFSTGILAMPLAMYYSGVLVCTALIVIFSLLMLYGQRSILQSLDEICVRLGVPHVPYRNGFRIALMHGPSCMKRIGVHGHRIIQTCLFLSQLVTCCYSYIFLANSVQILFGIRSDTAMLSLLLPLMLLMLFVPTLKWIGVASFAGSISAVIGLAITLYYTGFSGMKHIDAVELYRPRSPMKLMATFAPILYCLSNLAVVLSIDKECADSYAPLRPLGIVNVGIFVPAICCILFGVTGYLQYGGRTYNVLFRLPHEEGLAITAISMYALSVVLTYPIVSFPALRIAKEIYHQLVVGTPFSEDSTPSLNYMMRPGLVLLSFLIVLFLPHPVIFISFVEAICSSNLVLVFPALMEAGLRYPDQYGVYRVHLVKCVTTLLVGITIFVVCMIVCVKKAYLAMVYDPGVDVAQIYDPE